MGTPPSSRASTRRNLSFVELPLSRAPSISISKGLQTGLSADELLALSSPKLLKPVAFDGFMQGGLLVHSITLAHLVRRTRSCKKASRVLDQLLAYERGGRPVISVDELVELLLEAEAHARPMRRSIRACAHLMGGGLARKHFVEGSTHPGSKLRRVTLQVAPDRGESYASLMHGRIQLDSITLALLQRGSGRARAAMLHAHYRRMRLQGQEAIGADLMLDLVIRAHRQGPLGTLGVQRVPRLTIQRRGEGVQT